MSRRSTIRSSSLLRGGGLLAALLLIAVALATWKRSALAAANSAPSGEPAEVIATAIAESREHRPSTTAIGTVLALRSVTLRNELAGTVRRAALIPGAVVEPGAVLVALDVSVEEADLRAREAQIALAETTLARLSRLLDRRAVSQEEVDRATAERDIARAEIARIRAVIERKTIRAPFRARVGMADLHAGQYLSEGTVLTTLQGVEESAHVDFAVSQAVAAGLRVGDTVAVAIDREPATRAARIIALDARLDPTTRNALIRARLDGDVDVAPGASARVEVPAGPSVSAVAIPIGALRSGPEGDYVWLIAADSAGQTRAALRPVRVTHATGDTVLVGDGLAAGDAVAVSGSFKLRPGVLVVVAQADTVAVAGGN